VTFFARSSTRLVELQKMIDWLIWSWDTELEGYAYSRQHRMYLGEEGVQAVDLLSFFDIGIVLRDTTQGEFVHEIDLMR
jgi:hypothetical protein